MFTRLTTGTVFSLLTLLILCSPPVRACSCADVTIEQKIEDANVIFAGKVTDVNGQTGWFPTKRSFPYFVLPWQLKEIETTVLVSKVWKGEVSAKTIVVQRPCPAYFTEGKDYLILGGGKLDETYTMMCTGTTPLAGGADVIAKLGQSNPPRPNFMLHRLTKLKAVGFAAASSAMIIAVFLLRRPRKRD